MFFLQCDYLPCLGHPCLNVLPTLCFSLFLCQYFCFICESSSYFWVLLFFPAPSYWDIFERVSQKSCLLHICIIFYAHGSALCIGILCTSLLAVTISSHRSIIRSPIPAFPACLVSTAEEIDSTSMATFCLKLPLCHLAGQVSRLKCSLQSHAAYVHTGSAECSQTLWFVCEMARKKNLERTKGQRHIVLLIL